MQSKKKIALFVGSDVTAQIVLNRLIDDIADRYEPIIFLPEHPSSIKANLPGLKRFAFYDRHLLKDVVYPFIENEPRVYAANRSPGLINRDQSFAVEDVADVNAEDFIQRLADEENLVGAVSIRCFQIFKSPIIDILNEKGFFLNLHPGVLPQYRGVMSTFRTIADQAPEYGWTLHKIAPEIDAGEILWAKAKPLDNTKSGWALNLDIAGIGAQCIMRALKEIEEGNVLKGYPQKEEEANYFTYPTQEELDNWAAKGITLIDPDEVTKTLVEKFSHAGTEHGDQLKYELKRAIDRYERNCSANNYEPQNHVNGAPAAEQNNKPTADFTGAASASPTLRPITTQARAKPASTEQPRLTGS